MKLEATKPPGRIRAAILTLLGGTWTGGGTWGSAVSLSGATVTADSMMRLSAVSACVRLISQTIATMPLSVYERTGSGKRPAPQHPLHSIIHDQPNADSIATVFWESLIAGMLLRGVGRAEKLMVGGRLVGLQFLHPDRLSLVRLQDGGKEWRYVENGRYRTIPDNRVWSVPGFSMDGLEGVSAVQYGAEVFGAAQSAERAANSTFARGLMPTTAWKYPQTLREGQREEAREAIGRLSGAVNSGKPVVLEAGMEVTTIGIDPKDAQLLESRAFSVEEICRWFMVPPFMVGHSEKSTSWGSGIEQQMIGFLTFTIGPWLKRLEQSIVKDLMSPADRARHYVKFSVEGLLRADSAARSAFYSQMVNNGIYTRDDVREKEDLPPLGGNAAVLTVQSAMVPLESIGKTDQPPEQG